MPDYQECPFCDRVFPVPSRYQAHERTLGEPAIETHIREDHHKVRLRKGSNYKWVDEKEIKARLVPEKVTILVPSNAQVGKK